MTREIVDGGDVLDFDNDKLAALCANGPALVKKDAGHLMCGLDVGEGFIVIDSVHVGPRPAADGTPRRRSWDRLARPHLFELVARARAVNAQFRELGIDRTVGRAEVQHVKVSRADDATLVMLKAEFGQNACTVFLSPEQCETVSMDLWDKAADARTVRDVLRGGEVVA